MASQVTALSRPEPRHADADTALDRIRRRVSAMTPCQGMASTPSAGLCAYRFDQPTLLRKRASFGVTMIVTLRGAKRVRFAGGELLVTSSRMLVVTQACAHETTVVDASASEPYLGVSLCFSPERVANALLALREAGAGHDGAARRAPAFVIDQDPRVIDALDRLLATADDALEQKVLAPLISDEILFRLLRSDAAAAVRAGVPGAADSQRILESMRFIREHHTDKLTVPRLARQARMSPSHFAHRFAAVALMSPMRYLREVRLQEARTLLLANSARASEVATRVGFESAAHFTREFKRRFGTPPNQYRVQA